MYGSAAHLVLLLLVQGPADAYVQRGVMGVQGETTALAEAHALTQSRWHWWTRAVGAWWRELACREDTEPRMREGVGAWRARGRRQQHQSTVSQYKAQREDVRVKKNVLLVYPEFATSFWSFKFALQYLGKKSSMPSLGLLILASLFSTDYTLKYVDMHVSPVTDADLHWVDLVCCSTMLAQSKSLTHVIARAKRAGRPIDTLQEEIARRAHEGHTRLRTYVREVVAQVRREYGAIHKDFRHDVEDTLNAFVRMLDTSLKA